MTATWDLYAKDLLRERPQDFVELILPGARYIARRESQFQMREIRLDRLIEVEYCGQRILINLEIQVAKDPRMGMRLLRYSLAALALTRLFAELVFVSDIERTQVVRRFAMLQNIEDTPTYKRLVQQGRIEGQVEGARQILVHLVQARFPSLRTLAEKQFATITDLQVLHQAASQIGSARTARDTRQYLQSLQSPSA